MIRYSDDTNGVAGGGKGEVLALQVDQIDWLKREITFTQSKTKGVRKETVITYPEKLMLTLKEHIGERQEFVFVTRAENASKKISLIG